MPDFQLHSQTILVTRPTEQADSLADLLVAAGAQVLFQPAIEIGEPDDWAETDNAIQRLNEFGWIVFASVNGVKFFLKRCFELGVPLLRPGNTKVAAIGSRTAAELSANQVSVDLLPEQFDSRGLAESLLAQVIQQPILLVRANRGSDEVPRHLAAAGLSVVQIVVYQSLDITVADPDIADAMANGKVDWVTVTSSAIARSVVRMFGESLRKTKLVSISPTTSGQLCNLGFPPAAEATTFNMSGLVAAMAGRSTSS